MRMNTSGTFNTVKAPSTIFHGVVNISSSVNDTEVLTRSKRNSADVKPVCVMTNPNGSCTKGGPGVIKRAGKMIIPVKNGKASQTRLTKKSAGMEETRARKRANK